MKSTRQSSNEFYGNVVLGDSISDAHSVTGSLSVSGSTSVTGSITATNIIKTINTTNSTTWTNGAMIVDGGVGIGKDTWISGSLNVIGNFNVLGSSSTINLTSSQLVVEDNIITVNGYYPYLRYAGIEAIDSGSAVTASLLWDGQNDYWMMVSSSNKSSRLLGTTYGEFGSETSLTSGYIPKITGGNTIANGVLFQSSSNIGYGTTTPAEPVVISANGSVIEFATVNNGAYGVRVNQAIKATSFYMYNSSGTINAFNGTILISAPDTGNKLSFLSDKMFISSSGNVGIGTATPSAKLHIYEANTNAILKLESDGADDSTDIIIDRPNTVRRSDVQFTTADTIDWVIGTIYNGGSANSKFSISTTRDLVDSKIVVDTSGNVGVGTTSPTNKLNIVSTVTGYSHPLLIENTSSDSTAVSGMSIKLNGTERMYVYSTPNSNLIRAINDAPLLFWTNNTEKVRILSDGKVGIGITSPTSKLHISSSVVSEGLLNIQNIIGNSLMYVSSSGNVGIGTTSPAYKLHVVGSANITNGLTVTGSLNMSGSYAFAGGNFKMLEATDAMVGPKGHLQFVSGSGNARLVTFYGETAGSYKAGDVWLKGDLYVGPGSSKYFIAENPNPTGAESDNIKYVAMEGPSKSVFNHGKAFIKNKSIEIDLPPEWKWLVDDATISVTLTSINKYAKLTYEIKNNKLIVYNKSWFKRNVNFSYQLIADRKDVEKLKVYDEFPLQS